MKNEWEADCRIKENGRMVECKMTKTTNERII